MKRFTLLPTALLVLFAVSSFVSAQDTPAEKVLRNYGYGATFQNIAPFTADLEPVEVAGKRKPVQTAEWLRVDRQQLAGVLADQPETIRFQLPSSAVGALELDLVRAEVTSAGFFVTTSDGKDVPYKDGVHYRGIVSGRHDTLVALSIFEEHIMALIKTPEEGELVLGRYGNKGDRHVLYNAKDLENMPDFTCSAEEPAGYRKEMERLLTETRSHGKSTKCVEVYFECDYAMYLENGSTTATVNFVTGMFNQVATIYANESITTTVKNTFVWTSPDSYSTSSSVTALNQFRGTSHSADLAHLLARGASGLGGVAWINGLCSSYGYAYSNINSTYANYPTYSWTVMVVAHEMGHNLGSPHTHSCSWSGGALDNCYPTEGSCSSGPPPPAGGGTIMSYCHLTSYGINPAAGFGTQPGNLIRNTVNNASCLSTCGGGGPSCSGTQYSGSLSGTGQQQFQPNGTYYYSGSGTHTGALTGPGSADFDLYLWKWNGSSWVAVASSTSPTSTENISYNGTSGYYAWRVYSYSGSGSYTLCLNTP
ncbi:MAG: M12 family metallo-peptidase [Acidobacteriota bacterium]|nr:M12 family metallo-peptidase [Acidobacteriota bacterium]